MGLTVSRKAAQKLVVRNKNRKILTVSREKKLTVKKNSGENNRMILTVSRKSHHPFGIWL